MKTVSGVVWIRVSRDSVRDGFDVRNSSRLIQLDLEKLDTPSALDAAGYMGGAQVCFSSPVIWSDTVFLKIGLPGFPDIKRKTRKKTSTPFVKTSA